MESRKPYPSDVSDEEWAFVAPYLALVREDAPQRTHDLREVFNGLRWIVRSGAPWRMLPHDFPPWEAVYQQRLRDGFPLGLSKRWCTTSELCCVWQRAGTKSPQPRSLTAARCALYTREW